MTTKFVFIIFYIIKTSYVLPINIKIETDQRLVGSSGLTLISLNKVSNSSFVDRKN